MYQKEIEKIIIENSSGAYMKLKSMGLMTHVIKITSFLDGIYDNAQMCQRFWHIKNKIYDIIICKYCDNVAKYSKSHEYMTCGCSKCKLESKNKNYKNTCIKKYGKKHYQKTDIAKYTVSKNNYTKTDLFKTRCKNSIKQVLAKEYKLLDYGDTLKLNHLLCGVDFYIGKDLFTARKNRGYEICTNCNSINNNVSSRGERELYEFISSIYNDIIIKNPRKIIYPYELDIYLPNINLAIEFNGTYHHADPRFYKSNDRIFYEMAKNKWDRDEEKLKRCAKKNIDLMFVWEYDWYNNKIGVQNGIIRIINTSLT